MNKRLEKIFEIQIRNDLGFLEVMEIYSKTNCKIYTYSVKKGETFQLYNPVLEERTLRLVERYFDIKRAKELKRR